MFDAFCKYAMILIEINVIEFFLFSLLFYNICDLMLFFDVK